MATIRSFTSLEQSKKLAVFLPLESADMYYQYVLPKSDKIKHNPEIGNPINALEWYNKGYVFSGKEPITIDEFCVPCWSLAALLDILPNKIVSNETAFEEEDAEGINDIYYKRIESTEDGRYMCCYSGNGYKYKYVADNMVDACVEMIVKLKKQNLL